MLRVHCSVAPCRDFQNGGKCSIHCRSPNDAACRFVDVSMAPEVVEVWPCALSLGGTARVSCCVLLALLGASETDVKFHVLDEDAKAREMGED